MNVSRQKCLGFSLVELLIVIAIMGILATLSVSNMYAARPHAQLERGEIVLSSFLKEARMFAVSEEANSRAVFDEGNNEYYLEWQDRVSHSWTQSGSTKSLPEGVTFVAGGITLPGSMAVFTVRGTLQAGGNIAIQSSTGEVTTFTGNIITGKFPLAGGNLR